MCTVTFIPLEQGAYIFTTSRDEHRDRPPAEVPQERTINGKKIVCPIDPVGGGSWVVATEKLTLCILNGAFEPHRRRLPYRHSRGLIPFHFLKYSGVGDFLDHYDFKNLEPFTFVVIDGEEIHEIRWDYHNVFHQTFALNKPKLWASAPLYSPEMVKMRERWFREFLRKNKNPKPDIVKEFYLTTGSGNPNTDLIIDRSNGVRTVSISLIEKGNKVKKLHYWPLDDSSLETKVSLSLSSSTGKT